MTVAPGVLKTECAPGAAGREHCTVLYKSFVIERALDGAPPGGILQLLAGVLTSRSI